MEEEPAMKQVERTDQQENRERMPETQTNGQTDSIRYEKIELVAIDQHVQFRVRSLTKERGRLCFDQRS